MAAPTKKKPLDRFPVIRTDDVDETRVGVSRYYGEVRLSVSRDFDGFRAHANHAS